MYIHAEFVSFGAFCSMFVTRMKSCLIESRAISSYLYRFHFVNTTVSQTTSFLWRYFILYILFCLDMMYLLHLVESQLENVTIYICIIAKLNYVDNTK